MALTVDKKGRFADWDAKYLCCALAQRSGPPQEANTNASAKLPVWKQHSTAASKLPTNRVFFTISSVDLVMNVLSSSDRESIPLVVGFSA